VHRGTVALYRSPSGEEIAKLTAGESRELRVPEPAEAPANESSVLVSYEALRPSDETASMKENPVKRTEMRVPQSGRIDPMPKSPMSDLAGLGSSEPVNALLEAADDARKRRQPGEAAALLARILQKFPDDPAGGVVALTLGRIRLDALHQPRAAADAFKKAAAFKGLPAPLREQAFARCVEAFHSAGDSASARSMRDLYKSRFPGGVWLPWVERWAAIE
jgi:hypothetical protein